MNQPVLVIGSHLVDLLVAVRERVIVLDNLSSGKPGNLPPQAGLIVGGVTHVACGLPGASCAMVWGGCGRHLVRSHETPCPLNPTGSCALNTASPMRVIRERM